MSLGVFIKILSTATVTQSYLYLYKRIKVSIKY